MWIAHDLKTLRLTGPAGLTIGAFDGVHRGHQALIRGLVTAAHSAGQQALVMAFDPLPWQVLGKGNGGLLSTLDERLALMEPLEVDGVVILPFNQEVATTPARAFIAQLVDQLGLALLWAGPDFALGRNREGGIPFLEAAGKQLGFQLHIEPPLFWEGAPVRSSRIRAALRECRLDEANGCLGRPYQLTGMVVHGEARGRQLGFPTINLELPAGRLLPGYGIYVCRAHLADRTLNAVTNVGIRPTFAAAAPTVEAYLLDFSGDLYGQTVTLDFLAQLRPELRFASSAELIAQMQQDVVQARAWLARED